MRVEQHNRADAAEGELASLGKRCGELLRMEVELRTELSETKGGGGEIDGGAEGEGQQDELAGGADGG